MAIVFARTRYEYASYTDYWKLVELAGFQTCYVDALDFTTDNVYIVSPKNGEWVPHVEAHKSEPHNATVVHWCLERPGGSGGLANFVRDIKKDLDAWYFDKIWFSDRYIVSQVQDSRAQYVVLGSHKGLGTLDKDPPEYDFAHMSYVFGRRGRIHGNLSAANVKLAPNGWGDERRDILKKSKFMLATHQDDYPMIEPLRLAMASAFAMPILLEFSVDTYPYSRGGEHHYVEQAHEDELVGKAREMMGGDHRYWQAMGRRLYTLMTGDFEFGRMVRLAVQDMREPDKVEVAIG